jgi:hypothetical protein
LLHIPVSISRLQQLSQMDPSDSFIVLTCNLNKENDVVTLIAIRHGGRAYFEYSMCNVM